MPSAGVTTKLLKQTIAFPSRKTLPHTPPVSVSQYAKDAYYFLTICADRNHYNIDGNCISKTGPLCGATAVRILCHLAHYRAQKNISPTYALVMPDHIHLIAKASECTSISNFIERYKHFTARDCGITWQKGYFDHRLRSEKEVEEKTLYIAMNPVRQGLVENIEQWPYRMEWK